MSWYDERNFQSPRGTSYSVIERGILGYSPFIVIIRNTSVGVDEIFGEGETRKEAFDDLRKKIGIPIKRKQ